jgi:crotonobetainyl-CoA:carnitine CoA-transferase CaiB-like acyl-CoA transferase
MAELDAIVGEWTAGRTRADVLAVLAAAGIPAAPVLTLAEVLDDPQIAASGMLPEMEHPRRGRVRTFGSPLHLSESPTVALGPAPALGEHTRSVLREHLGLSDAEIDAYSGQGAI